MIRLRYIVLRLSLFAVVGVILSFEFGLSMYRNYHESLQKIETEREQERERILSLPEVKDARRVRDEQIQLLLSNQNAMTRQNEIALGSGDAARRNLYDNSLRQSSEEIRLIKVRFDEFVDRRLESMNRRFDALVNAKAGFTAESVLSSASLGLTLPLMAFLLAFFGNGMEGKYWRETFFGFAFIANCVHGWSVYKSLSLMLGDVVFAAAFSIILPPLFTLVEIGISKKFALSFENEKTELLKFKNDIVAYRASKIRPNSKRIPLVKSWGEMPKDVNKIVRLKALDLIAPQIGSMQKLAAFITHEVDSWHGNMSETTLYRFVNEARKEIISETLQNTNGKEKNGHGSRS